MRASLSTPNSHKYLCKVQPYRSLTKIKHGFDQKPTFQIEIDNVTYLNRSSRFNIARYVCLSFSTIVQTPDYLTLKDSPPSSSSRHQRFNYNALPSSSVALGKRKQVEDDSADHTPSDYTQTEEDSKRSRTANDDIEKI